MRSLCLLLSFDVYLLTSGCSSPEVKSDEAAECEFRQIEESIRNVKTLSVRVRVDHAEEGEIPWLTTVSTISVGRGNRSSFADDLETVSAGWHHRLLSDGSRVQCTTAPGKPFARVAPDELRNSLIAMISRTRVAHWNPVSPVLWGDVPAHRFAESFSISSVRSGAATEQARELTYVIRVGSGALDRQECSLWYDPKTLRIFRRIFRNKVARILITETYEEFAAGVAIPDEFFRLSTK